MKSVVNSLAVKTLLCREYLDFVRKAISAQIKADNIKFLRIHASGDFFSIDYVNMWKEIATENASVVFWTYTKFEQAEEMFKGFENAHVVPSIIKGKGFNFGTYEDDGTMYIDFDPEEVTFFDDSNSCLDDNS